MPNRAFGLHHQRRTQVDVGRGDLTRSVCPGRRPELLVARRPADVLTPRRFRRSLVRPSGAASIGPNRARAIASGLGGSPWSASTPASSSASNTETGITGTNTPRAASCSASRPLASLGIEAPETVQLPHDQFRLTRSANGPSPHHESLPGKPFGGSGPSYVHGSGGGPAAPMAKHQPVTVRRHAYQD